LDKIGFMEASSLVGLWHVREVGTMLYVDREQCTGCGACLDACPVAAISLVDGKAAINTAICQQCQACVTACSRAAIRPASERLPVVVDEAIAPQRQIVVLPLAQAVDRPMSRPWLRYLGAVLAYTAQELLPMVSTHLLQALDRRKMTSDGQPTQGVAESGNTSANRCRQRQHRGR